MRINKYISTAGFASRRKADELVINGAVKVNGVTVKQPGIDVKDGDVVEVNGRKIDKAERLVYIMLNKPVGYVTTAKDEKDRRIVSDLVMDVPERIFPVGRLDYNTSGLLIMTNDGDLAYKMMHPKHKMYKTYRATVQGIISPERVNKLRKGVDIGGFVTAPAKVNVIKQTERFAIVEISIYEGKNRQVRKMFASVGNKVQELERVAIGEIYLARLMTGHYRKLAPKEIEYLKGY
ncbi:MAG: pseudouridine synthase [Eubacteriales bacterium]|nr:pseudouridine synthase [Eubacteriales bacterium]MDD4390292.1 pseudouridine synthase [Eubacteriales bacterium]